ncbi:MAG: glycosyltransferase family 4 protein [Crocinitomicaceae bacterium]|nr:glycosyltransferase family 4 protein [Crocinitomicaceae bacterium]
MNLGLLITSTGWGGLEMNTLKLARLLAQKGYRITLFTQQNSSLPKHATNEFYNVVFINKHRKYFDFSTAKILSILLKENDIQQVMLVDNKDLDVLSWVKRLYFKSLKIVYQQHMQLGINKKDILHTFRFKSIDHWISPLHYLKDELALRTRYPMNRISVIPIGVDTDKLFRNKYTKEDALALLNIQPKYPLLGIIGRISEKKGQLLVVKAAKALIDQGKFVEVLIFGSPTINDAHCQQYDKDLKQYVSDHQLQSYIHFVAHKEDVAQFYNAIDVFVLASESETYGMVTIEAMFHGLTIVATKSGGTTEILGNGKFGLLYPQNDVLECQRKIEYILENHSEIEKMRLDAQKMAQSSYTHLQEVDAIDNLLTNT